MDAIALVLPPHDPVTAATLFTHLLGEGWRVNGYARTDDIPDDIASSAEFLLATTGPLVDASFIARCPKLRLIQVPGHGYDHVDVSAASAAGIPVATVQSSGAEAHTVAEMTMLLAGVTSRRIVEGHTRMRGGEFSNATLLQAGAFELAGKTMGIVGFGRIGREVAKRARAFDMRVLYADPSPEDEQTERSLGVEHRSLDDLLAESDFVTLHLPATSKTRGMIDARAFGLMKHEAILINTSRGSLVDKQALVEALRSRRIRGAAFDVYDPEPPEPDDPLLQLDNVVLSPHMAGVTAESLLRILQAAMANCNRVARGEDPIDVVDEDEQH